MRAALAVLGLLLVACSSDASAPTGGPPPTSKAPGECRDYVGSLCYHQAECTAAAGDPVKVSSCEAELERDYQCDRASGVGGGYSRCLSDLVRFDCASYLAGGGALPSSCVGIIVIGGGP